MIQAAVILDKVISAAMTLGKFDSVNAHEPKSAPARTGVSCSMWLNDLRPVQSSGLASTSCRLEFVARIYTSMLQEPADTIDLIMIDAADALLTSYIGGVQLGGLIRNVDVFGADGEGLRCLPGYLTQDSKAYRVVDIYIPLIVNDVWTEGQ